MRETLVWGTLALVVALSLGVRIRLLDMPLERDEGEYGYVAQLLLEGVSPYSAAYSVKTPGAALVYAPFVALLGDTPSAVRTCLLLVNAATIVLLFLLARRLFGAGEGLATAATFSVLALGPGAQGLFANAEHFVNAFALAGLLVLLSARQDGRLRCCFAGGLLLGLAVLMKQHGIAFAALGGLLLIGPKQEGAGRAPRATAFALGVLLPISLLVLALWWTDGLSPFLRWSVGHAWRYLSFVTPAEGVGFAVYGLVNVIASAPLAWLLALLGVSAVAWDPRARSRAGILTVFSGCAIAAVAAAFRFRPHYFLYLLPVVSLWAAIGAAALARRFAPGRSATVVVALVIVALGASIGQHREILFRMSPNEVSEKTFGTNPFPEAVEVARVLRERSDVDDRIGMLASEPEIYYYARRRAATPFLYMTELLRDHEISRTLQDEMVAALEASRPRYLIFSSRFDPFGRPGRRGVRLYRWVRKTLHLEFTRIGVVEIRRDRPSSYRWGDEAAMPPQTPDWLMVYERTAGLQPSQPVGAASRSQGRSP